MEKSQEKKSRKEVKERSQGKKSRKEVKGKSQGRKGRRKGRKKEGIIKVKVMEISQEIKKETKEEIYR